MADNRGVAYMGRGKVEIHDIDFPTLELKDGPGVNPANVQPTCAPGSPSTAPSSWRPRLSL